MICCPFPDRENSMKAFQRDYAFPKIAPEQVEAVFDDAWAVGAKAARAFLQEYGDAPLHMQQFLREQGFRVQVLDIDNVLGKQRYFCEYFSQQKIVKIYRKSMDLWCTENGFTYDDGCNLILCHEYFHHLEWHKLGLTSRRYLVPMLQIGKLRLGKTGVPALSEIAANAFACECFDNTWAKREALPE